MKSNIGGKLQGISLDAFLQMAQMEQITCTLSVASGKREGVLFLKDGNLISAETTGLSPLDAAQRIISWERTVIDITESCSKTEDEIRQPLMNILMEAMRIRDDAEEEPDDALEEDEEPTSVEDPGQESSTTAHEGAASVPDIPGKKPVSGSETPAAVKKVPAHIPISDPPKRLPWKFIIPVLILAVAGAGVAIHFLSAAKQSRIAYETLVQSVEITEVTAEKLALLNAYIRDNRDGKYIPEANRMIENILDRKTTHEFEIIDQKAFRLSSEGDIEGALALYKNYLITNLGKGIKGPYWERASKMVKNLSAQIETADFEEMQRVAMAQGPERIATYQAFLETHPDSSRRQEILRLISEMEEEYFIFLQRTTQKNETPDSLAETIEYGQQFLDTYPGSPHTETVNRMLDDSRTRFLATLSFEQLQSRADAFGTDYESAWIVYEDYLQAYPGSPVREKIEKEIDRLTELAEGARLTEAASDTALALAEAGTRFKIENNETALDKRTGLMWALLDSRTASGHCMTYDKASAYVAALETGGHEDWRLPTPEELSTLYKQTPSFPSDPEAWYWSSETEKRYVGQWIIEVSIFQPGRPEEQRMMEMESWQCGSARAVRRP